ncbi:hypothetical protein H4S08_002638 [Coemansia sp. RSA 1365]|nr:hypothetical protein H4S08_002638 [Coemansia sp. RSA 1365]
MLKLKQILTWCVRHKPCTQRRPRVRRRRTDTLDSTGSIEHHTHLSQVTGVNTPPSTSSETLVDEKHRERRFSDTDISEDQHVYSYYPWTESEHEEILRRSPPPPLRRHYETFPSLVEMGGFLSL